jgi:hypothetical protein
MCPLVVRMREVVRVHEHPHLGARNLGQPRVSLCYQTTVLCEWIDSSLHCVNEFINPITTTLILIQHVNTALLSIVKPTMD